MTLLGASWARQGPRHRRCNCGFSAKIWVFDELGHWEIETKKTDAGLGARTMRTIRATSQWEYRDPQWNECRAQQRGERLSCLIVEPAPVPLEKVAIPNEAMQSRARI